VLLTWSSCVLADQPEADTPHFDIWEFQVQGNSLLDTQLVERVVYPWLGPDKTIADVEAARKELEAQYHQAGYQLVLVDIPEQKVQDGVVRLSVTETRVDRVHITGARYYSLGHIRKTLSAIARGAKPHIPSMQEELAALAQESPDRTVTPVMRAGRTPGTVEFELKVQDKLPLHGGLELNNLNTPDTTRARAMASLRYDNLWQRGHSVSLQYQMTPENTGEVSVLAGTYVVPLDNGLRLALYAVRSKSDISTIGSLNVIGDGTIVGARAVLPVKGSGNWYHSLTAGFDYKDFNESVLQGSDTSDTPISYLPVLLRYEGGLRGRRQQFRAGVGVTFGVRDLVDDDSDFDNKRFGARSDFYHLNADFDYQWLMPGDFRLRVRGAGQLADQPLISNEQFSAGGNNSVRGYFESQALGDDGFSVGAEFYSPFLAPGSGRWLRDLRALLFADLARLRVREALPSQRDSFSLSGAGFGFRLDAGPGFSGSFDYAWALESDGEVEKGDQHADFRLRYEF